MAQSTGLVQRLNFFGTGSVCVWIGPDESDTEILFIAFHSGDDDHVLAAKKSMLNLLVKAKTAGYQIQAQHGASSAEITSVSLTELDISPVGHAILRDFYSITGSGIPDDVELVFETDTTLVTIVPDMVRPHWVFVAELPTSVPLGRGHVSLQAPGYQSDAVPVDVVDRPRQTVRSLYPGAPKGNPYTIAFVANPMLETEQGDQFMADPVIADRAGFHDVVAHALNNLLTLPEDLLRQDDLDAQMRFVSVFDNILADSNDSNALVKLNAPNLIGPRQSRFEAYLARYAEIADVAFAITGSSTHTRASARFSRDADGESTAFTYDGSDRVHGHGTRVPGVCTLSIYGNQSGLTPLHEYGHMAAASSNGAVVDLYVNGGSGGFQVNKKFRAASSDPVPTSFGTYNGAGYNADPNRDSLGYPADWTSYHAAQIDPNRPNLMDNYWLASSDVQACRLDRITYDWFSDRLRAKIFR